MKTKRIVALALTAAMAVSMASMTAFAADLTWKKYEVNDEDDNPSTEGSGQKKFIQLSEGDNEEYMEGFVVRYKVAKWNEAGAFNDSRNYVYRMGSTYEVKTKTKDDGGTVTTKLHLINADDTTQTGGEKAGVLWKNFKSVAKDLGTPSLDEEYNYVFLGWTTDSTKGSVVTAYDSSTTTLSDSAKAEDNCLKDDSDIIALATAGTNDGTEVGKEIIIYPVFRPKTATEKLNSQVAIANRTKVAKPVGEKEWVYSQKDLDRSTARISAPLAEDVSADALKKCNAEMKHSRVYEIKPAVQKDGTDKVVELRKGAIQEVKIPIKTLYSDTAISTDNKINDLISKGKLKVYHIGSDGKSRQVTGIKAGKNDAGEKCVVFKSGFFSEFVITKDPNARAQAGEEDGKSGGNPATGEASTLPVAMLALAALSATGVVAYKKRKAE